MNAIAPIEQSVTPFADAGSFETAQRIGKALASSSLVPEAYRGPDKLPNVLIALEVAHRIGASPLAVMQSLYIVQGRPSWSASFLIATVNACGRFTPLRFETVGDDPDAKTYRVRAIAKDKESGDVCEGPWITWKMVDAEGWSGKSGSKWKSMPALMFMYRSAAFWTRVYAPELSLGMQTAEEVQDVYATTTVSEPRSADVADLQKRLQDRAQAAIGHDPAAVIEHDAPTTVDTSTGAIEIDTKKLRAAMHMAESVEALDELAADISMIADADDKAEVNELYLKRREALGGK